MHEKPIIICLTPVRNEAWILDTFLQCTSLWADHIIIADQNSTDGSKEIAIKYPKVILVENNSDKYDEYARQQLLLAEARKIRGKRLLITLDADEMFTANFAETNDWQQMLNGKVGDSYGFRWINLKPGFRKGWHSEHFPWAMIDDNYCHEGRLIHSPRLPVKEPDKVINLNNISVLHYQYTNWKRMESKHRFYQCLERLNFPDKDAIGVYRMYHHMYAIKKEQLFPLREEWFANYESQGIQIRNLKFESRYWFDDEVIQLFNRYGVRKFRKEAIWSIDWNKLADSIKYNDPRNLFEKLIHFWLKNSQVYRLSSFVKYIDTLLIRIIRKLGL
jgi:glycosyltransferase involved in cell wall biosynthesis